MPPFQPRKAEMSAAVADIAERRHELSKVGVIVRRDMEMLCPLPQDPANVHLPRPGRQGTGILKSIKATYEDPDYKTIILDEKTVKLATRAWLQRHTEDEGDPIYIMVDRVPVLPMSSVAQAKRPVAAQGYSHARVFSDGTVEFNPNLYGQSPDIERLEELMGYVVDTIVLIGEQQEFGIARMAAPANGADQFSDH